MYAIPHSSEGLMMTEHSATGLRPLRVFVIDIGRRFDELTATRERSCIGAVVSPSDGDPPRDSSYQSKSFVSHSENYEFEVGADPYHSDRSPPERRVVTHDIHYQEDRL
jgi:hypothetical protein